MNENWRTWAPLLAIVATALILIAMVAINAGGGHPPAGSTTTMPPSTTTIATTTIPASTTSMQETTSTAPATTTTAVAETTTTSVDETTTTVVDSTTTSAGDTTTTTAGPATVELATEGVQAGEEWVPFGTDDDDAVAALEAVLGPFDFDSGWIPSFSEYGVCPGDEVRGVEWGDFIVLATKADTDFWTGGVEHFFAYNYIGAPPDLFTTEGVGLGSTLEDLDDTYGGPDLTIEESPFDPAAGFWSYKPASWTGMWGFASGQTPTDLVTSINGGRGCGE